MAEPQNIVYEFDPVSNLRDETGYWRLMKAESQSCKVSGVPTPVGISPWLLPLIVVGVVGVAYMETEGKKKRGK